VIAVYLQLFDPLHSSLCTCPPKYSLSPYTGCPHSCQYCYTTSYIKDAFHCRGKKNFITTLARELKKADRNLPVSIANSSDPYPPQERNYLLTKRTLSLLAVNRFKVLIVTKSPIVVRDIPLLKKSVVSISVTTLNEKTSRKIEPGAPTPQDRLKALGILIRSGIPCTASVDPIIPMINEDAKELIEALASVGVKMVTSSTYKAREDSLVRMTSLFPELKEELVHFYKEKGKRIGRSIYLPYALRYNLMKAIREEAERWGMEFATCREGFSLGSSRSCDGSHLLP